MGLFEKLVALPALRAHLEQDYEVFIEDPGWRGILQKVKQLKEPEFLIKMISDASPVGEQQKVLRGYLCTMVAEVSRKPVKVPSLDYAGCYLTKGELVISVPSDEGGANYIGMGMKATTPDCRIVVEGQVGDYLAYRAAKANVEVKGSARDKVGMAVGEGYVRIEGDVAGGIAGNTQNTVLEVDGSVGRVYGDNCGCKIIIGGDVHWNIGENQWECFIKVCGSVGMKYSKSGKLMDVAVGLAKNSVLLIGGDVWGNLGSKIEVAKVLVWGRIHGEVSVSNSQGGFVYINKKKVPLFKRIATFVGRDIGVKYVGLKESGYLFAKDLQDVKDLIL